MKNLKLLRKEYKLTQEKLAAVLGVARSSISMWESDINDPDNDMLIKIARYFDVSVDFLLDKTDVKKEKSPDELTYDDFTVAMHGFSGELSEEQKQIFLHLAKQFVREKRENKNKE